VAKYSVLEGRFQDIIDKIGAGGMFIRTKRKIALGQPIATDFPLIKFKNTIQVPGRVVHIDPEGFAVTFTQTLPGLVRKEGHFPAIVQNDVVKMCDPVLNC
jgi:Tfp pilus assembly protein PilZ